MANETVIMDIEDYNKLCELVDSTLKYIPSAFRENKNVVFNRIVDKYENSKNVTMVCMTQKDFDRLFDLKKDVADIMSRMVCMEVSENDK